MLESLLEASRHLLVPEMSQNKAVAIARQVVGSLLQVRLEQCSRSSHNRPKGYLGQFLLDMDCAAVLSRSHIRSYTYTGTRIYRYSHQYLRALFRPIFL